MTGNGPETGAAGNKTPRLDTSVAHQARIYNYWLGGKENFAADQQAAERALAIQPDLATSVRANRAFLARAVRYLAGDAGIRQFLDLGSGIPTANNTHQVAQAIAPESRIVYVDYDPVVLLHAQALLTSTAEGACGYVDSDLRDTGKILIEAAVLLDFTKPTAVMLLGVLQAIPDSDDPWRVVATLLAALPAGSYLVISHPASDIDTRMVTAAAALNSMSVETRTMRDKAQITRFFADLELLSPGVVPGPEWRPDSKGQARSPGAFWAGVGRKP